MLTSSNQKTICNQNDKQTKDLVIKLFSLTRKGS